MFDKADRYCHRYSDARGSSSVGEKASIFMSRVCLGSPHLTKCALKGLRRPPCEEGHFDPPENPGYLRKCRQQRSRSAKTVMRGIIPSSRTRSIQMGKRDCTANLSCTKVAWRTLSTRSHMSV